MEDSPLKLGIWLIAIWLEANAKNSISSYEVTRSLGVTQKTGWFVQQRIRLAMQNGDFFQKLTGEVEVDETFIGGKARRKAKGRGAAGKAGSGFLLTGWAGTNPNGVLNIFNGSVTNNSGNDTQMGFTASIGSFGMFNVLGLGAFFDTTAAGAARVVELWKNTGNFAGVLNLNGGTLLANSVMATNTGTPTYLGFNGGTLKANSANATFITGITTATIYSGGAIIDTNGVAVTVPQSLLAPTGSGLTSIPVTTGGAGYIGAPAVRISGGGGTGASAIAIVDLNSASPTFGQVTGFTITRAGNGYTSAPLITLVGGGATTPAVPGTATQARNATTGTLTKNGLGTLTLSSAGNTFVGGVTINNGSSTLATNDNVIPAANTVTVNGGSFDLVAQNNTLAGVVLDGGALSSTTGILTSNSAFNLRNGSSSAILQGTNGINKTTSGVVTLSGANVSAFTGGVNITGGTLSISNDAQLGDAANGVTINNTGVATGPGVPALQYNQSATLSMARAIAIGGNGGNIDVVNGGTLSITNATGLAAGSTGILNKTGLDTLTFTRPVNTTGGAAGVMVTGGTLNANFGTACISSINVGALGKLNLTNPLGALGTPTTLTLAGDGNLSFTGGAQLGFELGDPAQAVSSDKIIANAAATVSGAITINLSSLTGFAAGTYSLLADSNGGLLPVGASYVLGSVPSNNFNYTINATNTLVQVTLQSFSGTWWTGATAAS